MQTILNRFQAAVALSGAVTQDAHRTEASGGYQLPERHRSVIVSSAFVHLFVAYEEFLESGFAYYATGGPSVAGTKPVLFAHPPTLDHAQRMFVGLGRFVDWSTPATIVKLAELYFDAGGPFISPINSAFSELMDVKTVRNACSHLSVTTSKPLAGFYQRWTGQPGLGKTVYETLLANQLGSGTSYITHATNVLGAVASQIASF